VVVNLQTSVRSNQLYGGVKKAKQNSGNDQDDDNYM